MLVNDQLFLAPTNLVAYNVAISDFFTNYIYRTVMQGTALIGACAGVMGCFLYLRKQSLLSDVIGHSAVAGVMGAFAFATLVLQIDGRSMLVITFGAIISSLLSVLISEYVTRHSTISQDTAMAICLALFYGLGITGLHIITHSTLHNRGGIKDYMFGNATSMSDEDVWPIFALTLAVYAIIILLWKEIKLFIFDPTIAFTAGFKNSVLAPILLFCATISIVIGVKAVGIVLMVAFAIMPAASARQWTKHLSTMVILAGIFGAFAGIIGTYLSVQIGHVPTGPMIVIVIFGIFLISIIFPPERSVLRRGIKRRQVARKLKTSDSSGNLATDSTTSTSKVSAGCSANFKLASASANAQLLHPANLVTPTNPASPTRLDRPAPPVNPVNPNPPGSSPDHRHEVTTNHTQQPANSPLFNSREKK